MHEAPPNSFTIHQLASASDAATIAADVSTGLSSMPKFLLPKYFYDDLGSHLFEAICCLPEYYPTRIERQLLEKHTDALFNEISDNYSCNLRLIELGSGSADKTRIIIESVLRHQPVLEYLPIDISLSSIERSSKDLLLDYPQLTIEAYAADFFSALRALGESEPRNNQDGQRSVVIFLGTTIGNLDHDESLTLLSEMRRVLTVGDVALIGADLKKAPEIILAAYNDRLGVTACFNRNLLVRLNRELGAGFDPAKFEHKAEYNEVSGRVEMYLTSLEKQVVRIRNLDLDVNFFEGETIHTENSYKYDKQQLAQLAIKSGFRLTGMLTDDNQYYSLNIFTAE
jgi:dimethylhistidine N-methyltransferase